MRLTLDPVGDLEVTDGITLGQLRAELPALIGPVTTGMPLTAGGAVLTDDQVCGAAPLAPGAEVHLGPSLADPAAAAARSAWHVAVVRGTDAGAVTGPGPDGRVLLGRAGPGRTTVGRLALRDPAVSREHAVIAEHAGRTGPRWSVTDRGSANGTGLRTRRRARVRRRRRVRVGDQVRLGDTVVELRAPEPDRPDAAPPVPPPAVPMIGIVVPVLASLALAAVTRNPIYLAFALTGPVGALVPALLRRRRRRRTTVPAPDLGPDPARVLVALAAGRPCDVTGVLALARSGLAVVGAGARPVARALIGSALLTDTALTVLVPPAADRHWAWLRWVGHRLGPGVRARVARTAEQAERVLADRDEPTVLVVEHPGPWRTAVDRWWLRAGAGDGVIGVHPSSATVPAWCRWTLTVGGDRAVLTGPGGTWSVHPPAASSGWADQIARLVYARDAAGRPDDGRPARSTDTLPARVSLADVLPAGADSIVDRWRQDRPGLHATLGTGPEGVFAVDLVSDGPHALVAGTTGAGKSELLQTLVLGSALNHPPSRLAMVLVDFKGGASFGPCGGLPHVVGQVTDLDPVQAARALDGLRWELRRREHLLAAAGASDLDGLRTLTGEAPPRLLVVVDEFRAVTEELAEFIPGLVRLAAQGRSLGIHLVLATQRPAGAVDGQMRANLALRVCLRVTEANDSTDVIDSPDAAALPADRPGRAIVRRSGGPAVVVQTAWAALGPDLGTALRWAPGWSALGTGGDERPTDHCATLVEAIRTSAAAEGTPEPARVWLPPLPTTVHLPDVDAPRTAGLLLGRTDPPGATRWGLLEWQGDGVLLVAGRAGSGRTTTLRTVVDGGLAQGWQVHVLAAPASAARIVGPDAERIGTVTGPEDPRLAGRLLDRLLHQAPTARTLLVVDDVAAALRALDRLPRGIGPDLWDRTVRECRSRDVAMAVTGAPTDLTRVAPHATDRLVLAVADPHDDAGLGVPRDLAAGRDVPGRAVHVRDQRAVRCQVGLPDPSPARPVTAPLRLRPLPDVVPLNTIAATRPGSGVPLGVGGDAAQDVVLPVATSTLVVGPAGTGRSTAAATLAIGLRACGHTVLTCADDGPLAVLGHEAPDRHCRGGADLRRLLDDAIARGDGPLAVVLDDAERLARSDPDLDERLATLCCDPSTPVLVVATARTDAAAAAYRGVCAAVRSTGAVVVLSPAEPGSAEVAGTDLTWAVDPVRPRHPGRGGLVHRGRLTPVQVAISAPG